MRKIVILNLILLSMTFQGFGSDHPSQIKGILTNAYISYLSDPTNQSKSVDELTKWQADECANKLFTGLSDLDRLVKMRNFERLFKENRRTTGFGLKIGNDSQEEALIARHTGSVISDLSS